MGDRAPLSLPPIVARLRLGRVVFSPRVCLILPSLALAGKLAKRSEGMSPDVDTLILVCGVLLLLSIVSSKFSTRFGVPVLVLFLGLGMLAGSEGLGGIEFEDYQLAYGIGTLALGLILFDGGLRTPLSAVASAWKPAVLLATVGVFITAAVTGLAASWILNISLLEGLLLGSLVGSTDAAAVFAILRSGGVQLRPHLAYTLEMESGSNDPMAIFMTIGCLEILSGRMGWGPGLAAMLFQQMVIGTLVGLSTGWFAVWATNRIKLDAAGLYPALVTAFGLTAFGLAAASGGSGFLSVYLAGIVIGNQPLVFKRGILLFHDAAAWLGQILLFVMLGLLIFPSRLTGVAAQGLAIAVVLILVARPIAVVLMLLPFRYTWREQTLISWVGLKGAVPITLATFPFLFGLPDAPLLFDIVFFVVLISAVVQGWSLPLVARQLKLDLPIELRPPVTLEISSLRHVDGDIVEYLVGGDSLAAGRRVRDLALPEGVVIALIARDQQVIPPQGKSRIEVGDHVIVVMRPHLRPMVDHVFSERNVEHKGLPAALEFPLRGSIRVEQLEEFYGITMNAFAGATLDEVMRQRLGSARSVMGASVNFGAINLKIRSLGPDGRIEDVGMVILSEKIDDPELQPEELPSRDGGEEAPISPGSASRPENARNSRAEHPENSSAERAAPTTPSPEDPPP
jgi:potassium/hydrogen antiporter